MVYPLRLLKLLSNSTHDGRMLAHMNRPLQSFHLIRASPSLFLCARACSWGYRIPPPKKVRGMGDGPGVLYNPQGKLVQGWCDPDRSFVLPKRVHVDCRWKRLQPDEPVPKIVSRLYQPRNVLVDRYPWWYKPPPWKPALAIETRATHRAAPKLANSSSKPSLVPTSQHRSAPRMARSASADAVDLARGGVPLQVVRGQLVQVKKVVGQRPSSASCSSSSACPKAGTATSSATSSPSVKQAVPAPLTAAAPAAAAPAAAAPAAAAPAAAAPAAAAPMDAVPAAVEEAVQRAKQDAQTEYAAELAARDALHQQELQRLRDALIAAEARAERQQKEELVQ